VGNCCTVGQATDENMAHAHCMLDTKATNTKSEYVIRILYNATMVTRTCLDFALYVHCLPGFKIRYDTTISVLNPPPSTRLVLIVMRLEVVEQ
jgi:hypothetical protein